MADARFFRRHGPFALADLAARIGAEPKGDVGRMVADVATLDQAGPDDLAFLDNRRYREAARTTRAGACVLRPEDADLLPQTTTALITPEPYRGYALIAAAFYPEEGLPDPNIVAQRAGIDQGAHVAPDALVAKDCRIGAGAVIESGAEIGRGTRIAANAVIGRGVVVGEGCLIGAGATISHARLGNRVIVHPGARIGQDGFGFALGAGHLKVPQLGRVIVEDEVEIGANTTIDRGSGPDTVLGRGTKIDNLVQIAHNVRLGEGCVVVAQSGISGSTRIGAWSVLAAQTGLVGHLEIGPRTRLAARSAVIADLPGDADYGGAPAIPVKEWRRQMVAIRRLGKKGQNP